jgi:signal transduction histidine kinase
MPLSGSPAARYGVAVALTVAVTLLMHQLDPWWDAAGRHPYLFEWPTVIAAAWLAGLGPGLVATVLASVGILFFWIDPLGTLHVHHSSDLVGLTLFAICGIVVSVLIASLHQARDRERLLRHSRETLLEVVAHDLRNPLGSIVAATALVRVRPEEFGPLDLIDRSVRRMDHLIRDLLDASVIDSDGTLSMIVREESVASFVNEAVAAATAGAAAKALKVVIEPFEDLQALCDRERMLQVLSNLIGNALKFTPEGGLITLRIARLQAFARIEVSDTGPGIRPAHQDAVFERYWRENRPDAGVGLGLFIARAIVRAHGGRLWLHSQPSQGTTFFLTLPAAEPNSGASPAKPERVLLS